MVILRTQGKIWADEASEPRQLGGDGANNR